MLYFSSTVKMGPKREVGAQRKSGANNFAPKISAPHFQFASYVYAMHMQLYNLAVHFCAYVMHLYRRTLRMAPPKLLINGTAPKTPPVRLCLELWLLDH